MRASSGRGAVWPWAGVALLLLLVAGVAVFAAGARAEMGAPALEPDGVWRARSNWIIGADEVVVHMDERVEAFGNITLGTNASLSLINSSLTVGAGGGARLLSVNGGLLTITDSTIVALGGAFLRVDGGQVLGSGCTLRFEGSAMADASLRASGGALTLTQCQVQSDASVAVESRDSDLKATDCDFSLLNGSSADLFVAGKGVHELDTTRFATLRAEGAPWVTLYVTVRFFLQDVEGKAVPGHVNGTGAYGEIFSLDTTPNQTAAMRFTWVRETALATSLSEGVDHGPFPLVFTASDRGTGGNTSSAWLSHHRENLTVVLDRPIDLAVRSFTIQGRSLSGPPLKRAYYLQIGAEYTLLANIANQGAAASPPTTLTLRRTALEADSWSPMTTREETSVEVPSIEPGQVVALGIPMRADTFGGRSTSTTPCSQSAAYTSQYLGSLSGPLDGDFASWNNERLFTAVAYDVLPVEGEQCVRPNDPMIVALGVGFVAAVVGAAVVGYQFSDKQVARRAARAEQRQREGPKDPPPGSK